MRVCVYVCMCVCLQVRRGRHWRSDAARSWGATSGGCICSEGSSHDQPAAALLLALPVILLALLEAEKRACGEQCYKHDKDKVKEEVRGQDLNSDLNSNLRNGAGGQDGDGEGKSIGVETGVTVVRNGDRGVCVPATALPSPPAATALQQREGASAATALAGPHSQNITAMATPQAHLPVLPSALSSVSYAAPLGRLGHGGCGLGASN